MNNHKNMYQRMSVLPIEEVLSSRGKAIRALEAMQSAETSGTCHENLSQKAHVDDSGVARCSSTHRGEKRSEIGTIFHFGAGVSQAWQRPSLLGKFQHLDRRRSTNPFKFKPTCCQCFLTFVSNVQNILDFIKCRRFSACHVCRQEKHESVDDVSRWRLDSSFSGVKKQPSPRVLSIVLSSYKRMAALSTI